MVLGDFGAMGAAERNIVWLLFTSADVRRLVVGWEARARRVLANFRAAWARHADDLRLAELIERLKVASPEFRAWWPEHEVDSAASGRRELEHPIVGRLVLEMTELLVPDPPELRLIIYVPLPEQDTLAKLRRLLRSQSTLTGAAQ